VRTSAHTNGWGLPRRRGAACAVAGLLGLASCGPTPQNPVEALPQATYVYAFEQEQVFGYTVSASGAIAPIAGARFRAASGEWKWDPVVADPFGRFLFGLPFIDEDAAPAPPAESLGVWTFDVDSGSGAVDLAQGSPFAGGLRGEIYPVAAAPSGRFLFASYAPTPTDMGGVIVFRVDPSGGGLTQIEGSPFPAGIGPRRLWPSPDGRLLYVSDIARRRPDGPAGLSAYRIDSASGALAEAPGSPYKAEAFVNQVEFHPGGRLLFATAGSYLLAYRIDPATGALEALPGPSEPQGELPPGSYVFSLVLSLDGQFLFAFQLSGWILTYHVNPDTGELTFVGEVRGASGFASWLLHPAGRLALVLGKDPTAVHVHRIDASRGLLAAAAPVLLGSEYAATARGRMLFFDASGQIVCVVVRNIVGAAQGVYLLTFRLDADAGTLTPVASARLGETVLPWVVDVRRGAAWPR
jgi:6-phosphogluconolactonase (cycloisomerase 2 family)